MTTPTTTTTTPRTLARLAISQGWSAIAAAYGRLDVAERQAVKALIEHRNRVASRHVVVLAAGVADSVAA